MAAARDQFAKGLAFQQLHDEEWPSFMFSEFVDGADVGVLESGSRTGFALKSSKRRAIFHGIFRQELECYPAPQPNVFRPIHQSHAATGKSIDNPVMRNSFTGQGEPNSFELFADSGVQMVPGVFLARQQRFHLSP